MSGLFHEVLASFTQFCSFAESVGPVGELLCDTSPQGEETAFYFDGSGYSVVEKALRSTATHIVMLFKTFSPNGLLLYLASNGTVRPHRSTDMPFP